MAWTNLSFSVGQILTAAQMNQLYDNFAAMAAGDSGAPEIVEAALAAAVAGQLVTNGDSHDHSGGDGGSVPESGLAAAVQNQLVTNGDSHNHSGGDGADVPSGSVACSIVASGTQSISASSTFTPSEGFWNVVNTSTVSLLRDIYVNSAWRRADNTSFDAQTSHMGFVTDGSNLRIYNTSGAGTTIYYQKY